MLPKGSDAAFIEETEDTDVAEIIGGDLKADEGTSD
jgi:hypothetical protein